MSEDVFRCWQVILKQSPDQQAEASERLMEFYRNPDNADFLCRVIEAHENLRFRQLAALGLRETCKHNGVKSQLFVRLVKLLMMNYCRRCSNLWPRAMLTAPGGLF